MVSWSGDPSALFRRTHRLVVAHRGASPSIVICINRTSHLGVVQLQVSLDIITHPPTLNPIAKIFDCVSPRTRLFQSRPNDRSGWPIADNPNLRPRRDGHAGTCPRFHGGDQGGVGGRVAHADDDFVGPVRR